MSWLKFTTLSLIAVLVANEVVYFVATYSVAQSYASVPKDIEKIKTILSELSDNDELILANRDGSTALILDNEQMDEFSAAAQSFGYQDYLISGSSNWRIRLITLFVAVGLVFYFTRLIVLRFRTLKASVGFSDFLMSTKLRMLGAAPKKVSSAEQANYQESLRLIAFHVDQCKQLFAGMQTVQDKPLHPVSQAHTVFTFLSTALSDLRVKPLNPNKSKLAQIGAAKIALENEKAEFEQHRQKTVAEIETRVKSEVKQQVAQLREDDSNTIAQIQEDRQKLSEQRTRLQREKLEVAKQRREALEAQSESETSLQQSERLKAETLSLKQLIEQETETNRGLLSRLEAGYEFCADRLLEHIISEETFKKKVSAQLQVAVS